MSATTAQPRPRLKEAVHTVATPIDAAGGHDLPGGATSTTTLHGRWPQRSTGSAGSNIVINDDNALDLPFTREVDTKRLLREVATPGGGGALRHATLSIRSCAATPDGHEGIDAFAGTRPPTSLIVA